MKYAHIETGTNKLLGWYADDVHGIWVEPKYENRVVQEEKKDDDGNIIQERITKDFIIKDGFYDISKIPTPNIEVSGDDWQIAIDNNANCYENGKFIIKDFRTVEEIEIDRISSIKAKAGEIIESKYSIYWQLNHPRVDTTYATQYAWIDNIRAISNEAELNGIALDDILWY